MYINSMQSSSFELICKDYRIVSFPFVSSLEYTCIISNMNQLVSSKNVSTCRWQILKFYYIKMSHVIVGY